MRETCAISHADFTPPLGTKFKGIFNFYWFTLSIIKFTAPEKTSVLKNKKSIYTCHLGQDSGPQTLFRTTTSIKTFTINTFDFSHRLLKGVRPQLYILIALCWLLHRFMRLIKDSSSVPITPWTGVATGAMQLICNAAAKLPIEVYGRNQKC